MALRVQAPARLIALVAVALATGCKKDGDDGGRKVTINSTDDATEAIVDQDYKFKISWPGDGWKLMREKDISRFTPDAVAGMTNGKVFGAVIVEQAPGVDLDQFAGIVIDGVAVEERVVRRREKARFVDRDAIEFEIDGKADEAPVRFAGRIFLNEGWAYQVIAWSLAAEANEASFGRVFGSFSLLPGAVTGRKAKEGPRDAVGVGWRLRAGTLESALAGLRVVPPAGWRAVVGDELEQMNKDAAIALVSSGPDAYLVVIVERVPDGDPKVYHQDRIAALKQTSDIGAPVKATVFGHPIELTRLTDRSTPMEYLFGLEQQGDRMMQLMGWYASGLRAQSEPRIVAALAALELLDGAALAALDRDLAATPDTQNAVGEDFALRRGRFLHFPTRLIWTRPKGGYWTVSVGQDARAQNPEALLYAEEARLGLHLLLLAHPAAAVDPTSYLSQVKSSLPFPVTRDGDVALGGHQARFFEGTSAEETAGSAARLAYRVVAAVREGVAVQLWVWGFEADMRARAAEAARLVDDLAFDARLVQVDKGRRYRDVRLGFELALPGSWDFTDGTPPNLAPLGTVVSWKKGKQQVFVIALCGPVNADDEWFSDFMEQTLKDKLQLVSSGEPKRDEVPLAGMTARHLRVSSIAGRADLYLMTRDRSMYGIIAVDEAGGGGADMAALAGFKVFD